MNEEKRLARAKQFAPFAALRGYYDMIRSKQRRIPIQKNAAGQEGFYGKNNSL